jgi:hypothetical protein
MADVQLEPLATQEQPADNRTFLLRVRLTQAERAALFATAKRTGQEVSAYVRELIFAEQPQPTQEARHGISDRHSRPS